MQKGKTYIKTQKMCTVTFAAPYRTGRTSIATAPHSTHLTQTISAKTFRKSREKEVLKFYSQNGKRCLGKAD